MSGSLSKIKKEYDKIILISSVCLSFVLRFLCRNFESGDFIGCLNEWVTFYKENGGFHALKDFAGDYNVLYQYILIAISYFNVNCLYLIKLVSSVFDFVLAYGCMKCMEAVGADKRKQHLCFAVIILLPTILTNSSFWAQCDSIYTAFIVWSIYFLIRKNNPASIFCLAVAFAFKLQTVFIMPVYIVSFLKKEIKLREILVFPAAFLLTYLPALAFGKPISDIMKAYITQTTEYPLMVMNAPSIFTLLGIHEYNPSAEKVFIGIAAVYVLIVIFAVLKNKHGDILKISLLFVMGIPFFLPHMHDRYFYPAVVFSVLCAFVYGKKYIPVVLLAELSSFICYMNYFDFINKYCGRVLSHLCSTYVSGVLMLAALAWALSAVLSKAGLKKYTACAVVSAAVAISIFSYFGQAGKAVWIDGKFVNFPSVPPYTDESGNTMIPLRNFVNAMGGTVSYDGEVGKVVISYNDSNILLAFNSDAAELNGKPVEMSTVFAPAEFSYLSHRDICELTGLTCTVSGNRIFFHTDQTL